MEKRTRPEGIEFIFKIDKAFNIQIPTDEISGTETVDKSHCYISTQILVEIMRDDNITIQPDSSLSEILG